MTEKHGTREAVYRAIVRYFDEHGYAPSVRELCEACCLSSPSSVYRHLKRLQKEGRIEMAGDGKARSITLTKRSLRCPNCGATITKEH